MAGSSPSPSDSGSVRRAPWARELAWTLGAAAAVVAVSVLLWAFDRTLFFWDDMQAHALPCSKEVARALGEGSWPLLTRLAWNGGSFAGELQVGIFSLFVVPLDWVAWRIPSLALSTRAALLAWTHLAVLGAGGFRLARGRGLGPGPGLVVALVAALNGWMLVWGATNWYPAMASFAWLPWLWWGLERMLRLPGARPVAWPALAWYLLISAGFPYAMLTSALIALGVLVVQPRVLLPRALGRIAIAAAVGCGLAAPTLLSFLQYLGASIRLLAGGQGTADWRVPFSGWAGVVFPGVLFRWQTFSGPLRRPALELTGALIPALGVIMGLVAQGRRFLREQKLELGLVLLAAALACLPGLGAMRWSFRWVYLFQLALALWGAAGIARWSLSTARPQLLRAPALWGCLAVLALWAASARYDPGAGRRLAILMGAGLMAWAAWDLDERRRRWASTWAAGLTALFLVATYRLLPVHPDVPRWGPDTVSEDPGPLDPQVRYLDLYTHADLVASAERVAPRAYPRWMSAPERQAWLATRPPPFPPGRDVVWPGFAALLPGVSMINGYSPLWLEGFVRLLGFQAHGDLSPRSPFPLLPNEAGKNGLLAMWGVDGLVVSDRFAGLAPALVAGGEWRNGQALVGGVVLRRVEDSPQIRSLEEAQISPTLARAQALLADRPAGSLPAVLTLGAAGPSRGRARFAKADLGPLTETRLRSRAQVSVPPGRAPALIALARPWYPGYRAAVDGRAVPVFPLNLIQLGVILPPGSHGELVVTYWPGPLSLGLVLAGLALLIWLGLLSGLRGLRLSLVL